MAPQRLYVLPPAGVRAIAQPGPSPGDRVSKSIINSINQRNRPAVTGVEPATIIYGVARLTSRLWPRVHCFVYLVPQLNDVCGSVATAEGQGFAIGPSVPSSTRVSGELSISV